MANNVWSVLKLSILFSDVLIIFGYCYIDQCFEHFEYYLLGQLQQTQLKEKTLLENRDILLGSLKDKTRGSNLAVTSKSTQGRKTWNLADTSSEKQRAYSVLIYEDPGRTTNCWKWFSAQSGCVFTNQHLKYNFCLQSLWISGGRST